MPKFKFDPQKPFDIAQDKHHRRSIRLKGYDYSQAGAYFVTLVAYQRDCLFGEIRDVKMVLNDFGTIADECWRAIPDHFPLVELGAYVVMPNHVHGIIIITDGGMRRGTPWRAPTERTPTPQFGKTIPGSIAAVIGQYKSSVSRIIKQKHNATGIWQRNYYEHIIRDDKDLQRITDYIETNPLRWNDDDENPVNVLR
jgi:REP element-mobilizing transposase RayT